MTNANTKRDVDLEILPLTKRPTYGDKKQYRAVYVNANVEVPVFNVPIGIPAITLITLNPWRAPALVGAVKITLKSRQGCNNLKVYRSTLIDSKQWQKLAARISPVPVLP